MSDFKNKNGFDFVESFQEENKDSTVETNVLIREEAKYMLKNFTLFDSRRHFKDSQYKNGNFLNYVDQKFRPHFQKLEQQELDNAQKILALQSDFQESKSILKKIENDMATFANNFVNASPKIEAKAIENEVVAKKEEPLVYVDKNFVDANLEAELMQSFENLVNLKIEEATDKLNSLSEEIVDTKNSFNNFINNYKLNLETLNSQQNDLNNYLASSNNSFIEEIKFNHDKFDKIETEIQKISSVWIESDKLIAKLEKLLYEISDTKYGYNQDLNELISEIRNQTIENKDILTKLNLEIENAKAKIEQLATNQNDIYEATNKNDSAIQKINTELRQYDAKNIENFAVIDQKIDAQDSRIKTLEDKVEDLVNVENFLDSVLSSKLFQKSLESKISNMICENNNYLGDEFKFRINHLENKLDMDLNDFKLNQKNLMQNVQNLESNVYDINSEITLIHKKYNISDQLMLIENKYNSLYGAESEKLKKAIEELSNYINNFELDENEVYKLLENSVELSAIIREKIAQAIDEKINQIAVEVNALTKDVAVYKDEVVSNYVSNEKFNDITLNVKNEVLNSLCNELNSRDKLIELHNDEILRNYKATLKFTSLLGDLEALVMQQTNEIDGLKTDYDNSFTSVLEKITFQKAQLEELAEVLKKQILDFDFYKNNASIKKAFEVWKNDLKSDLITLVKNLVEDEIKGKCMVSYAKEDKATIKKAASDDFFVNRVKDILNRLDNESLKATFKTKVADLNFKIDDLKKEQPTVKDDDMEWFFEKEYNEFVSSKQKQ
ncbi:MAG: hypothetical protein HUJ42_01290 [Malacoplasma sp.]|nr:hypothetical protein [Malacoplasma sp.]